jgi:hypothetical protein
MPQTPNGKSSSDPKSLPIRVVIDELEPIDRIYSNHVELRTTPLDVTLSFCDIEPPKDMPPETKDDEVLELRAKLKTRIVLTHDVFYYLAHLLASRVKDLEPQKENK